MRICNEYTKFAWRWTFCILGAWCEIVSCHPWLFHKEGSKLQYDSHMVFHTSLHGYKAISSYLPYLFLTLFYTALSALYLVTTILYGIVYLTLFYTTLYLQTNIKPLNSVYCLFCKYANSFKRQKILKNKGPLRKEHVYVGIKKC